MGGRVDQTSACSIVVPWRRAAPRRSRGRPGLSRPPDQVVVPFPAGGPTDGMARIIADRLGTVLGQSIVIENKGGGAGGSIGAKFVAAADPDGYTILITPGGSLTTGPAVHKNIGYDPVKVFVPVAQLIETPLVRFRAPDAAGEDDGRACGLRQGQSGQGQLGLARLRRRAAPPDRTVQARNRRQHRARALSRHGADARRHSGRRSPGCRRPDDHEPGAHRGWQAARDRDRRRRTHAETAGRADRGGGGISQAAIAVLARRRGAGRNAATPSSTSSTPRSAKASSPPETRALLAKLGADIKIGTPQAFGNMLAKELALWTGVVRDAKIKVE